MKSIVNFNTIEIGIFEALIALLMFLIIDSEILRGLRLKNVLTDKQDIYITIFAYLLFPFINLAFRNYRASFGGLIGIPVAILAFGFIFTMCGYRG